MRGTSINVLVACEFSGTVRLAFRDLGHDAWSCDLEPCIDGGPHIQGDALTVMGEFKWDLMIAHPPCTHLASSGARYWPEKRADGRQEEAIKFFLALMNAEIPRIAVENPVGIMSTAFRKPDQIVQPYQFGDPLQKKICLWLKGLPPLVETDVVIPTKMVVNGSMLGGKRKDGGRKKSTLECGHRSPRLRSMTPGGIAAAMANQWGSV